MIENGNYGMQCSLSLSGLLVVCGLATIAVGAEPVRSVASARSVDADRFAEIVQPYFMTYCLRCHDAENQEGKFRLDTLGRDFTDEPTAQKWSEVVFRMNSGEMPPKDEPQLKAEELGKVVDWITARITEGEAARMAKRGPVAHYRLSRDEYANTVEDLLGVYFDVNLPGAFNEDPRWHGFERIGSMLSLSPSHVDRYFKAAEKVLESAFPDVPPKLVKVRRDADDGREKWHAEKGGTARTRWPMWPGSRRGPQMVIAQPGNYRIRIQLSGMQTAEGLTPHLSLWHQQLKRSVYDQDIVAAEEKPITLDFEMPLSPGGYELVNEAPGAFNETGNHTLNVLNGGGSVFTSTRDLRFINPTGYKLFDDDGRAMFPMLLVDWIEWEGPLTSDADLKKRDGLVPKKDGDLVEARECLERLATRAWRRPATEAEVNRYVKIVEQELAAGEKFRAAYRAAMVGILTSKNFYGSSD